MRFRLGATIESACGTISPGANFPSGDSMAIRALPFHGRDGALATLSNELPDRPPTNSAARLRNRRRDNILQVLEIVTGEHKSKLKGLWISGAGRTVEAPGRIRHGWVNELGLARAGGISQDGRP